MRKRLLCCDQLSKRVFEICDRDKANAITFRQLCFGLIYFCPNSQAEQRVKRGTDFVDVCTRFMDLDCCGCVSKLSMYTVCDLAFEKEESYLLSDAIWEVLTDVGCEMRCEIFSNKLAGSETLREIFHKLMLLQGLEKPSDTYEDERIIHGPVYTHELFIETYDDLKRLCGDWCEQKANGQFFFMKQIVLDFKVAANEKLAATKARDNEKVKAAERSITELIRKALEFQETKKGKDHMRVGHYCKVMLGVQEKGWDFIKSEIERVRDMLLFQVARSPHLY